MQENTTLLHTIDLASQEGGRITLSRIECPYGKDSEAVVSIGVVLKGDEPDWKVHIPYQNIDELIEALKAVKSTQQ